MEMHHICLVIVLNALNTLSFTSNMDVLITSSDGRIRGIQNTQDCDFILGGLFRVHSNQGSEGSCSEIVCSGGTDTVEAMLFAIDEINRDPSLLPNLTLGYDIRDTCSEEHIGLDEAASLILLESINSDYQCNNNSTNGGLQNQIIGLIGAAASRVSIPVAGLTRLFEIPQVSYSSTSAILSNREQYSYFYRTIPSDTREAVAIVDMLRHFNWTFISTVFTRDSYGQSGIDDLHDLAQEHGICIDISEGIEVDFSDSDFEILAERISSKSEANVIVVYAHQEAAQKLVSKMTSASGKKFTWIASSAWVQFVNNVVGIFGVIPTLSTVSNFTQHFDLVSTQYQNGSTSNPWLSEFLQCNSSADPDYAIPRVIDAVYTFAHALNDYLKENCAQPITWIPENRTCVGFRRQLTGSVLLEYIKNTSFIGSSGMTVNFDSEGGVQPLYDIFNYRLVNNQVKPNKIGTWNSMRQKSGNTHTTEYLEIANDVQIHYGLDERGDTILQPTESHCGRCEQGMYLREVPSSCCGLCEPCLGQSFSNSSYATECLNCSFFGDFWGNNPTIGSSGCVSIPQIFLDFDNPWSIVVLCTSALGLVVLFCVVIIFGVNWNTPVIRASGRESMITMIIGTTISFIVAFIYVAPPSLAVCIIQQISVWLGFGLIFSSLTAKVVRIARIFVFQTSGYIHLKCINSHHIITQILLLFSLQVIIVLISLLARFPEVVKTIRLDLNDRNNMPEVVVTCTSDHELGLVVSIVYETGLVVTSAVLATLSFRSPANFNEAKSICIAAFGLLLVWIVFFPTYFALQNKQELQNAAIAGTVTLTAYVVLVCLFGPRLFIALFCKKKNTTEQSSQRFSESVIGKGETKQHMTSTLQCKVKHDTQPTSQ